MCATILICLGDSVVSVTLLVWASWTIYPVCRGRRGLRGRRHVEGRLGNCLMFPGVQCEVIENVPDMETDNGYQWLWMTGAVGILSPGLLLRPHANNALLTPPTERQNNSPWLKFKEVWESCPFCLVKHHVNPLTLMMSPWSDLHGCESHKRKSSLHAPENCFFFSFWRSNNLNLAPVKAWEDKFFEREALRDTQEI